MFSVLGSRVGWTVKNKRTNKPNLNLPQSNKTWLATGWRNTRRQSGLSQTVARQSKRGAL